MIKITDLYKSFDEQDVLTGINLTIETGDIVALLGESGSGKSVLLKNIIGLMRPDKGDVKINGKSIHHGSRQDYYDILDDVGMLFQNGALFDSLTVYENLAFPLREKTSLSKSEISERISERLEMVSMDDTEEKYPAELSGGMKKRVALARAMILNPSIIFFDEPTTGLDPVIGNGILRLIYNLHQTMDFTAVIVTHNFHKVFDIVHKVAMIYKGKIIADEEPDTFMNSENEHIQTFVREAVKGPLEANR